MPATSSVSIRPGPMLLTRVPAGPSSSAAARTSMSMPAFPTQYGPRYRWVSAPAIDEMPTNDPRPARAMTGAACLRVRNVPTTFTSTTARNLATSHNASGPMCSEPPAAASTASRRPPAFSVAAATAAATASSSVTSAAIQCSRSSPTSAAADLSRSSLRPAIVTAAAPPANSRRAQPRPIPLPPDHLSGGRFVLGLGVSGPQVVEGWYGQSFPKPLARTREYVDVVRKILAREERVTNDGPHYPLPYPGGTGLGKPLRSITHP